MLEVCIKIDSVLAVIAAEALGLMKEQSCAAMWTNVILWTENALASKRSTRFRAASAKKADILFTFLVCGEVGQGQSTATFAASMACEIRSGAARSLACFLGAV